MPSPTRRVRVGDDNARNPAKGDVDEGAETDRTGAEDHHTVGRSRGCPVHGVTRDGHGLVQRSGLERNAGRHDRNTAPDFGLLNEQVVA